MKKEERDILNENNNCLKMQRHINDLQLGINRANANINDNFLMRIKRLEELVECNLKDIDELQGDPPDQCSGTDSGGFNGYKPRFKI